MDGWLWAWGFGGSFCQEQCGLFFGEAAAGSGRQAVVGEASDARAAEAFHLVAHRVKHEANLALQALAEGDLNDLGSENPQVLEFGAATFYMKSLEEFFLMDGVECLVERDFVFLLDRVAWVREALGEVAIIGHHEQSLALLVEASDMEESRVFRWHQVINRAAATLVGAGHNKPSRLVEKEGNRRRGMNAATIDPHIVIFFDLCGEILNPRAIDHYSSRGDELIAGPPGAETGSGQKTVQPHCV